MGIKERAELRKRRIVARRARNFIDAEHWDLEFWQRQTSEMRLSALIAIQDDIKKVKGR